MATYTITTNENEEDALAIHLIRVNAARAAETPPRPPLPDHDALVPILMRQEVLGPVLRQAIEQRVQAVANAYREAPRVQRRAVDTTLGVP
jgi:hypothetical protein